MNRDLGGPDAQGFIRKVVAIEPSEASFDAAFSSE